MAKDDREKDENKAVEDAEPTDVVLGRDLSIVEDAGEPGEGDGEVEEQTTAPLGAQRYVHAAFFVAGIILAFVAHKVIGLVWGLLADWSTAVRAVPQLVSYAEDEREGITMVAGALVGALAVIQTYRREGIRRGADEVAAELSKVTWPTRDVVLNGTIVVVVASAIATVYVAILDRFWSFLTTLVYGA